MPKRAYPVIWSSVIFFICLAITFSSADILNVFVESSALELPEVSLWVLLLYFVGAVALVGLILLIIRWRIILSVAFALLLAWGTFLALELYIPIYIAAVISLGAGTAWFLQTRVWLHDLLLLITLSEIGAYYGFLFSPPTFMIFMFAISIYDVLAVRFGYMMWLAEKMSASDALAAFVIPKSFSHWNVSLKQGFGKLMDDKIDGEFSILGGGDVGMPLLLSISVFAVYGLRGAVIIGGFAWLGIISAFVIQMLFLKGKAMPALPPITLASLSGFLIVYFSISPVA